MNLLFVSHFIEMQILTSNKSETRKFQMSIGNDKLGLFNTYETLMRIGAYKYEGENKQETIQPDYTPSLIT